jgi:hypothetical protein
MPSTARGRRVRVGDELSKGLLQAAETLLERDDRIADLERQLAEARDHATEQSKELVRLDLLSDAALDRLREVAERAVILFDIDGEDALFHQFGPTLTDGLEGGEDHGDPGELSNGLQDQTVAGIPAAPGSPTNGLGELHDDQPHILPSDLWQELASLRADKDTAYSERNRLVAFLAAEFTSSLERHPDGDKEWEDDWRWIVYIQHPVAGQLSWHIHDSELSLFDHVQRQVGWEWDGHTTKEKWERIREAIDAIKRDR